VPRVNPKVKALALALSKYDAAAVIGMRVEKNSPVWNEGHAALEPFNKMIDAHNAGLYKATKEGIQDQANVVDK
jgi:hypothetical protein